MAPRENQLSLPPTEVLKDSRPEGARTNASDLDDAVVLASFLFDAALDDAKVTSYEASLLMGVSESYVNRMRSANYRECVSLIQLIKCGPVVLWHFHCALHRKEKFAQVALRETLQALSLVAVGIE